MRQTRLWCASSSLSLLLDFPLARCKAVRGPQRVGHQRISGFDRQQEQWESKKRLKVPVRSCRERLHITCSGMGPRFRSVDDSVTWAVFNCCNSPFMDGHTYPQSCQVIYALIIGFIDSSRPLRLLPVSLPDRGPRDPERSGSQVLRYQLGVRFTGISPTSHPMERKIETRGSQSWGMAVSINVSCDTYSIP